mmetsp:Transcript_6543/g.21184  ORF Transcript_6543/g.21184 Transcript_6543/m.21184 type:complete len:190 (-) Transcript_6543:150-719(-)
MPSFRPAERKAQGPDLLTHQTVQGGCSSGLLGRCRSTSVVFTVPVTTQSSVVVALVRSPEKHASQLYEVVETLRMLMAEFNAAVRVFVPNGVTRERWYRRADLAVHASPMTSLGCDLGAVQDSVHLTQTTSRAPDAVPVVFIMLTESLDRFRELVSSNLVCNLFHTVMTHPLYESASLTWTFSDSSESE